MSDGIFLEDSSESPLILIVEDDASLRVLIARTLKENGFRTTLASAAPDMWRAMKVAPPDLILLDVMLPGTNGLDLCRAIRLQQNDVPIIMISAQTDEVDRVLGLEFGADDYVPKPFGTKELLARVRAILRRRAGPLSQRKTPRDLLIFLGWKVDLRRRELFSPDGVQVELSGAEFDLLNAFLDHPQRIIGRERLMELSRARLTDASDRSVDVLVSRLRRKLSQNVTDRPLIRTVRGAGYMFAAEVERA
jgi:two-component system, OmpR family, response regulator